MIDVDIEEFIRKTKNFLVFSSTGFKEIENEWLGNSMKYFISWAVISSILYGIVFSQGWNYSFPSNVMKKFEHFMFGSVEGVTLIILLILLFFSLSIIFLLINSLWLHIWIKLMGGKGDLEDTINVVIYGGTPSYVLGWVPFVGSVSGIWGFIISLFGIKELHDMSYKRAAAAVILSSIVLAIIISALVSFFIFSYAFSQS